MHNSNQCLETADKPTDGQLRWQTAKRWSFHTVWVVFCLSASYQANGSYREQWFCPDSVDRFMLSVGTLLESRRADITKMAMSALAVIKTFDVVKHISSRFISS